MHSLQRQLLILLAIALVPFSLARAQLTIEIVGGAGTTIPVSIVPFEGESWAAFALLGLCGGVEVLAPDWMRRRIGEQVLTAAANYGSGPVDG